MSRYLTRMVASVLRPGGSLQPMLEPVHGAAGKRQPEEHRDDFPLASREDADVSQPTSQPVDDGLAAEMAFEERVPSPGRPQARGVPGSKESTEAPAQLREMDDPAPVERFGLTGQTEGKKHDPGSKDFRRDEARSDLMGTYEHAPSPRGTRDWRVPSDRTAASSKGESGQSETRVSAIQTEPAVSGKVPGTPLMEPASPSAAVTPSIARSVATEDEAPFQPLMPQRALAQKDVPAALASSLQSERRKQPGQELARQREQPQRAADDIQIHIGRIEVTAIPPPPLQSDSRPARKSPSLDAYLRRGNGRA